MWPLPPLPSPFSISCLFSACDSIATLPPATGASSLACIHPYTPRHSLSRRIDIPHAPTLFDAPLGAHLVLAAPPPDASCRRPPQCTRVPRPAPFPCTVHSAITASSALSPCTPAPPSVRAAAAAAPAPSPAPFLHPLLPPHTPTDSHTWREMHHAFRIPQYSGATPCPVPSAALSIQYAQLRVATVMHQ
ncbi:hypothetical protein HYPSUDRAFT_208327 [Hypholoma sublateritium FD-334 SS-4]|uniref:Uncharacterized protein n=1 Tax=Hypholoma sublateritium (strain FD-334 SS-4) TaxID=945553 RepID=A0A0D2P2X0_HYPSF|nr:hypothetical protein HYPSUDRAFT_208327 [Hypholoma sublateritium FD-334 SS-4]